MRDSRGRIHNSHDVGGCSIAGLIEIDVWTICFIRVVLFVKFLCFGYSMTSYYIT